MAFTEFTTLHNGVKMPWLGLGVWQAANGEEVERAVRSAIETGYRHIDTAAIYKNEEGVGRAIKDTGIARDELFITTKVWNSDQGYESTLAAYETSRKKLGVDYIDLYLIHWAVKDTYKETWRALEKLYKDGHVRAIGVSNFEPEHLQDLMNHFEIKPMVDQVECHPFLTQNHIYNFCKENGIQMEAWSPLMRGGEVLNNPVVTELAQKYGKTAAQIILRWDLDKGIVTIPKSVTPSRIQENAGLFDFKLDAADVEKLNGLNKNQRSFEYDPKNVTFK